MSTILRRRGELPPIEPYDEERELQDGFDDDIFQVFVDYISPCQIAVSNDPFEPQPTNEPNPCNITLYDCSPNNSNAQSPIEVEVEFDYEMHYTIGSPFNRTLEGLEGSILEHLATATGLVDCPILDGVQVVRNRELQDFPDLFSALSSEPADKTDLRFGGCLIPVESAVAANSRCDPMTGYLTAFLKPGINPDASQKAYIRSGIQRFVRDGMNNDIYVTGNIRKVSFIGRRTGEEGVDDGVGVTPIKTNNTKGNAGSSGGGLDTWVIVVLAVGCIVVLTLAVSAFIYRKRRNAQEKENSNGVGFSEPAVAPDDLSTNELFRRDEESVGSMEGADIPGSLANTDKLAKTNGDQKKYIYEGDHATTWISGAAVAPNVAANSAPAAAAAGTAAAATVASSSSSSGGKPPRKKSSSSSSRSRSDKNNSSSSRGERKKKRREERKKKLPAALDAPSLDSIPEEETDDESQLLPETQAQDGMDTTGILGEEQNSSEDDDTK